MHLLHYSVHQMPLFLYWLQKFFVNAVEDQEAGLGDVLYSFKNGYGHIGGIMFVRTVFICLWSVLLIIPGIVKMYEYMMVPFILAENPDMSRKEVFALSKKMMTGNKWKAFVLDLSFLGWSILGGITLGILNVLFVAPYQNLTKAELYQTLKDAQ